MATVVIHSRKDNGEINLPNPLPTILQTPSGLAIVEMQGTINLPSRDVEQGEDELSTTLYADQISETAIGRLVFPEYTGKADDGSWMKRVYLYVGKHQRLPGEVRKLPKAMAVIRKRDGGKSIHGALEVVEIIKHKIIFSHRPEPVGDDEAEG